MTIVIALDSFKGSLSSIEAGNAVRDGLKKITEAEIIVRPLADGGEGTIEALIQGLGGKLIDIEVTSPLGKKIEVHYGIILEKKLAVIEMAKAAGITIHNEKNPTIASTFGVGEIINDAMMRGCREFIIGIGGSATNDGGTGLLKALGVEFYDKDNNTISDGASGLSDIRKISLTNLNPIIRECNFKIACDVNNPLFGENGATYVYGPQKGLTQDQIQIIDQGMKNYAKVTAELTGKDYSQLQGAGAAGGLGFAFVSFLGAKLYKGIDLILELTEMENYLKKADIVFTGEGCLDVQTSMGKAPIGVARLAKKHGALVIGLSGCVKDGAEKCNDNGIDAFFPITRDIMTIETALKKENAISNIQKTAEQVIRLINAVDSKK